MKKLALAAFAAAISLGFAQPASAHYVKDDPVLYSSYEQCVGAWSEISHGTGKGYLKAETNSTDQTILGVCGHYKDVTAGNMIVHPQVWQDNGSFDWLCTDWGEIRNAATQHLLRFERTFGAVPSGGSCTGTSDWYGTYTGAYVRYQGVWRGGWAFSGWHKLPTTPSNEPLEGVDPDQPPDLDPWVDPVTMVVDLSLVPDGRFPVPQ